MSAYLAYNLTLMEIIRPKRYIHLPNGKMRELCPGVLIKSAKVIPADPEKIAKTNRKQQYNKNY